MHCTAYQHRCQHDCRCFTDDLCLLIDSQLIVSSVSLPDTHPHHDSPPLPAPAAVHQPFTRDILPTPQLRFVRPHPPPGDMLLVIFDVKVMQYIKILFTTY